MRIIRLFTLIFLPTILLFGCTANQNDQALDTRKNDKIENVRYDPNIRNNVNDKPRVEVADKAIERIIALDEVKSANILVTNRNAYVAVVLENDTKGEMTDQLEEKIAEKVKKTDPDINNVFVSSNPDFVERMTDYSDRVNEGDPVEGFFEEFNEVVRRVFPNAR